MSQQRNRAVNKTPKVQSFQQGLNFLIARENLSGSAGGQTVTSRKTINEHGIRSGSLESTGVFNFYLQESVPANTPYFLDASVTDALNDVTGSSANAALKVVVPAQLGLQSNPPYITLVVTAVTASATTGAVSFAPSNAHLTNNYDLNILFAYQDTFKWEGR